jgi:thymidylate kinase
MSTRVSVPQDEIAVRSNFELVGTDRQPVAVVPWVVLLGIDGSGKSTVQKYLVNNFSLPFFAGIKTIYRRVDILGRPLKKGPGGDVINHYAEPPYGQIKSVIKLGIRALDWLAGYWLHWARYRAKGYLLLMDRHYFLDMAVAPVRFRYGGPPLLPRLLAKYLPGPNLFIFLDAPVEILQARKKEVTPEEGTRQRELYLELMLSLPYGYVVDASQPVEQVVSEITRIIIDHIQQ